MKHFRPLSLSLPLLAVAIMLSITSVPVRSQITTPCTPSMISSFTPCMNFVTNSSLNGTAPTSQCCSSLKSLTNSGVGCLCLIVAGGVPFQMPVNRTLAISLPRACNMPGVPLQCKAAGAPVPAPGPATLGLSPSPSPASSPIAGSTDTQPDSPALSPESDTTPLLTPPSPTVTSVNPTTTTGSRSNVNPSAASSSNVFSPALLLVALASAFLKYY